MGSLLLHAVEQGNKKQEGEEGDEEVRRAERHKYYYSSYW
jgi:hypothetical protein